MPKPSHREKLLAAGLHVVLEQGYCGASVRDIVQAAGVPQGSFTNHFRSKEAFCLEVLERYFDLVRHNIEKTLRNDATAPLQRLRAWVDLQIRYLEQAGMRNGCLIGNYGVEASEHSEAIRRRLVEIFAEIHESVVYCLKAAGLMEAIRWLALFSQVRSCSSILSGLSPNHHPEPPPWTSRSWT
jgi:TetR/AcrR family transcriptional regulator, transcriptional repressor for nem operon